MVRAMDAVREVIGVEGGRAPPGPLAGGAIYDLYRPELAFAVNGTLLLLTALLVWIWFVRGAAAPQRP